MHTLATHIHTYQNKNLPQKHEPRARAKEQAKRRRKKKYSVYLKTHFHSVCMHFSGRNRRFHCVVMLFAKYNIHSRSIVSVVEYVFTPVITSISNFSFVKSFDRDCNFMFMMDIIIWRRIYVYLFFGRCNTKLIHAYFTNDSLILTNKF